MKEKTSLIEETFNKQIKLGKKVLIPYITVGYPNIGETVLYINEITKAGADIIELGVPCGDPLADGPTIQEASQIAIQQGVNLPICLDIVQQVRDLGNKIPIALMGYCNSFMAYGFENFVEEASKAGVNGLIIPDLLPEMAGNWVDIAKEKGIDMIFFIAPTSTTERIELVTKISSGFIYCISTTGVTGVRNSLPSELPNFIKFVRERTTLPLAVGFGISKPQHVSEISNYADGAIIGSALIRLIKETKEEQRLNRVGEFISSLKKETLIEKESVN